MKCFKLSSGFPVILIALLIFLPSITSAVDCSLQYSACEEQVKTRFAFALKNAQASNPGVNPDDIPEVVAADKRRWQEQENCNSELLGCKLSSQSPNACSSIDYSKCVQNADAEYNQELRDLNEMTLGGGSIFGSEVNAKQEQITTRRNNRVKNCFTSYCEKGNTGSDTPVDSTDEGVPAYCLELMKRTDKCFTPMEVYNTNVYGQKASALVKKYQTNNPACDGGLPSFFTCFSTDSSASPTPTPEKLDCTKQEYESTQCERDLIACQNYASKNPYLKEGDDYAPCLPELNKCTSKVNSKYSSCPKIPVPPVERSVEKKCKERKSAMTKQEFLFYLSKVEDANPSRTPQEIVAGLHRSAYDSDAFVSFMGIDLFLHGKATDDSDKVKLLCKTAPRFLIDTPPGKMLNLDHSYAGIRSDIGRKPGVRRYFMRLVNTHLGDVAQVIAYGFDLNRASSDQIQGNSAGIWIAKYYARAGNKNKPLSVAYAEYFKTLEN